MNINRLFHVVGSILAWFGVITQFYLLLLNGDQSLAEKIVRFFSFFTILSNIIVAVSYTGLLFPSSKWGKFFSKAGVLTAVTVYILVVGLVYNVVLRQIWEPTGLQKIVDEVLHTVNPLLFLLFWITSVSKQSLSWGDIPRWLIYPLVYCIYIIVRGASSGWYPYPFMDVGQLGYAQVTINALVVTGVFLFFSSVFVGIGKLSK